MDRRTILEYHIRYNHFPSPENIGAVANLCEKAINSINDGDPDAVVCRIDSGVGGLLTARQVADDWHLWDTAFITREDI